eukprot:GHVU01072371.1.p2 GENE.GHVU01072371.1~~GHVU01072371.1.p2  ORF type:complete len:162 (-),score=21.11 GHVU01072371.1:336-821(-)
MMTTTTSGHTGQTATIPMPTSSSRLLPMPPPNKHDKNVVVLIEYRPSRTAACGGAGADAAVAATVQEGLSSSSPRGGEGGGNSTGTTEAALGTANAPDASAAGLRAKGKSSRRDTTSNTDSVNSSGVNLHEYYTRLNLLLPLSLFNGIDKAEADSPPKLLA